MHNIYISVGRLATDNGAFSFLQYYKYLGDDFYQSISSILIFDAIIYNDDRHFGNFGLLRDKHSVEIIKTAPIFDNELSLFNYAMDDDVDNLEEYAKSRVSAKGANHTEIAKVVIGSLQKEQLRKLINFKFKTT